MNTRKNLIFKRENLVLIIEKGKIYWYHFLEILHIVTDASKTRASGINSRNSSDQKKKKKKKLHENGLLRVILDKKK